MMRAVKSNAKDTTKNRVILDRSGFYHDELDARSIADENDIIRVLVVGEVD